MFSSEFCIIFKNAITDTSGGNHLCNPHHPTPLHFFSFLCNLVTEVCSDRYSLSPISPFYFSSRVHLELYMAWFLKFLFAIFSSLFLFFCDSSYSTRNYMFKVNNRNTRARCEICSKLTNKTQERRHWCRSSFFIVNSEHISNLALVFLLLFLSRYMPSGLPTIFRFYHFFYLKNIVS